MGLISSILGVWSPKHRTLGQWAAEYEQLISKRPVKPNTLRARRLEVRRIMQTLGADTCISQVRPMHIAQAQDEVYKNSPIMAQRFLCEARCFFAMAVRHGWIDRNPADHIKQLPVKVKRRRLTLEEWQACRDYAQHNLPPWVTLMLELALVSGQRRGDLAKMRFDDVHGEHLYIVQGKTGSRIALPLALRLEAIGLSLGEVIVACQDYAKPGEYLLRQTGGRPLGLNCLTVRFINSYKGAHGPWEGDGTRPSLHECRSLAERLYREQGINTRILLGHSKQTMTDKYHDDRGLDKDKFKYLILP